MGRDDADREDLYALPRDDFLAARDARAKELKAAGDREAAEEIKKLRKPTVAAWAINRLARTHPEDVERLVEAGEMLAKLQRKAASGVSRDELRTASAARRKAIDSLVGAAEGLLREAAHPVSRQTLDHVAQTLEAVAVDESARDLVRRGVLDRELAPEAGFGDLAALTLVPGRPAREKASAGRRGSAAGRGTGKPPGVADEPMRAREREREARRRERADRLGSDADQAEAEARRLRDDATRAERAAMKARDAAHRAEARAAQARKRADAALADRQE